MAPILLKIKGNKSFSPFCNLDSEDELSKTWRVCTKVKDSLENGSRLENLSWRLWFVHNILVDGAKKKSQFKKLSSVTTRKLDKEKGQLQLGAKTNYRAKGQPINQQQQQHGSRTSHGSCTSLNASSHSPPAPAPSCPSSSSSSSSPPPPPSVTSTNGTSNHPQTIPQNDPMISQSSHLQDRDELHYRRFVRQQQPCQQQEPPLQARTKSSVSMPHTNESSSASASIPFSQPSCRLSSESNSCSSSSIAKTPTAVTSATSNPTNQSNPDITVDRSYPSDMPGRQVTENFVLHQYTSDQACDQVVELEDIFGSFGDMQQFLNSVPGDVPAVDMQLYDMLPDDWNHFSSPVPNHSLPSQNGPILQSTPGPTSIHHPYLNTYSDVYQPNPPFNASLTNLGQSLPQTSAQGSQTGPVQSQPSSYEISSTRPSPSPTLPSSSVYLSTNPNGSMNTTPLSVSNATKPDDPMVLDSNYSSFFTIPNGALYNKLLATFPPEMLQSAERLLSSGNLSHLAMTNEAYADASPAQMTLSTARDMSHGTSPGSDNPNPNMQYAFLPPSVSPSSHPKPSFSSHTSVSQSVPTSRATSPSPDGPDTVPGTRIINSSPSEGKNPICSNCGTSTTPLWRRSTEDELLCNACGLYLKLHNAPRPRHLKPHTMRNKDGRPGTEDETPVQTVCSNCATTTTPLWRRDIEGSPLCNACGLYLKLHHEKRPLSMKTDVIKKRQRCENSTHSNVAQAGINILSMNGHSGSLSLQNKGKQVNKSRFANHHGKDYRCQGTESTHPSTMCSTFTQPLRHTFSTSNPPSGWMASTAASGYLS
ncbi:uncharacterized protein BYT42DRAFT_559803 [Radiomyces spectabilis]|uniref:uncharacterized protein n=1 Tax=Radiomyces spectabilis TaxID=64574 RepID=UPI00221F641F|nr:uncharacterized protein BYT42DRAFT_559803 [Radiomyces spectabilis]KAI8388351.1 hypothetical protein BYT42DRAFT_559803 [Radiomyces spectabilis]